ncbi:MAG: hypothetical protein ACJAW8_002041 [Oleispira sp.]|jgi:hypothetical protein
MKVMLLILAVLIPLSSNSDFNAAERYYELSLNYEKSIINKEYQEAFTIAVEQIKLDPSDVVAYLRMAISSQHINVNRSDLIEFYSVSISERNAMDVELKKIATALLMSKN